MHNFIYPTQNSYITNYSGYADSNFSLDSILQIQSVNQIQQSVVYYITQSATGYTNQFCGGYYYNGYISASYLSGYSSYISASISGSAAFSSSGFTGIFTGSGISASYTGYTGSLSGSGIGYVIGSFSGSVSGSVGGSTKISGNFLNFTGSLIGTVSGTQSIYQPYLVFTTVPIVTSRALLQFDLTSVSQSIANGTINTGSLKFYLNLKTANVTEIPLQYTLYAYPLLQSWQDGDGRYQLGGSSNGVNWTYTDYYGGTFWSSSAGGGYYSTSSATSGSQYFNRQTSDVKMDITNMAMAWISGSLVNNGLVLLTSLESNSTQTNNNLLQFFSSQTNTIYYPYVDSFWDDSSYDTGSLSPVTQSRAFNLILHDANKIYKSGNIVRFNVFARDGAPLKNFQVGTQLSQYLTSSYVPQTTYFSIIDNESSEVILDFDNGTKLSCDGHINYFYLDTTGLPQERYYRIITKTVSPDGRINVFDNGNIFKITR